MSPPNTIITSQQTIQSLDKELQSSASSVEDLQIEIVDRILQHKRQNLIQLVFRSLDKNIEESVRTATMMHDMRLTQAAGELVDIVSGMRRRMEGQATSISMNKDVEGFSTRAFSTCATGNMKSPTMSNRILQQPFARYYSTSHHFRATQPRQSPPSPPVSSSPSPSQTSYPKSNLRPVHRPPPLSWSPPPPREPPTKPKLSELPFDQLKKTPEYKSKSRKWVTIMVGTPVIIVLGWDLYKKFKKQQAEREMILKTEKVIH